MTHSVFHRVSPRTASGRLRLLQVVTVLSTMRIVRSSRPAVYDRYSCFAREELGGAPGWRPGRLRAWRWSTVVSGISWLARPESAAVGAAFAASSTGLQRQIVGFHRPLYNYTNHLPMTAAIQAAALAAGGETTARSALRSAELLQATVYAQAAAMKLRDGGIRWLTDGDTVRVAISELGRARLLRLARSPGLVRSAAAGSVAVEAAVLPVTALGGASARRTAALGLLAFHGGIKATIDISFWHLWWQLLPQLLWPRPAPEGPSASRASALPAELAVVSAVGNVLSSALGRNIGPFCAYNMFSGRVPAEYPQLRSRVYRANGTMSDVEDTRGLLPFEFFRTVSVLEAVFLRDTTEAVRAECARAIVDGLNEQPWKASDEVYPSVRQPDEPAVTGFDVLLMTTSSARPWVDQRDEHDRLTTLYRFRLPGTA